MRSLTIHVGAGFIVWFRAATLDLRVNPVGSQTRESVMDDAATAREEIDEVLMNVDRALARPSRAVTIVGQLEGTSAEFLALTEAQRQLEVVRQTVAHATRGGAQQKLV